MKKNGPLSLVLAFQTAGHYIFFVVQTRVQI